jgi:hypothetical protein
MTPFTKLADNFKVSWDIDSITDKIIEDIRIPGVKHPIDFNHPTGEAWWRNNYTIWGDYDSVYTSFVRNFPKNFFDECTEVVDKLKEIQRSYAAIPTDNKTMIEFINHEIIPQRVNLVRTVGGRHWPAHSDFTRSVIINIGLQNSNTHVVKFSEALEFNNLEEAEQIYNSPTIDYIMNDGDVYLLEAKKGHWVKAVTSLPEYRYTITYLVK